MPLAIPTVVRRAAAATPLAAALVLPPALRAQPSAPGPAAAEGSVTVLGFVTDTTSAPVPAAEVLVAGTPVVARTDARGAFQLDGVRPGTLTLTVRRLGFRARSDEFRTRPGDTLQLVLDLVAVPAELAEVSVTGKRAPAPRGRLAEFESRRERGFGAFVTRAEIEKRRPMLTSDLLRTIPGVAVVSGSSGSEVRMARSRRCAPDIYIDGLEARGYRIDDMSPANVGAIEVFRGPAETPARFRRLLAGCGVVSIWTRDPGT
jgi:hypothetical protein